MDLVKTKNNEPVTDSYIVAEKFGKKHKHVLAKIDKLKERLVAKKLATKIKAEISYKTKLYRGQEFRYCELNKKAFSLLVMSFTGDEAFEWQEKFYDAFALMEQSLLNKSNQEWKAERVQGKQVRRELTDAIKQFVEYAVSQGSKSATKYYSNITKMEYKTLGLIEKNEKVPDDFRNMLDTMQLHQLIMAEHVAQKTLVDSIEKGYHYKEIYQIAKANVTALAKSMFICGDSIKLPSN